MHFHRRRDALLHDRFAIRGGIERNREDYGAAIIEWNGFLFGCSSEGAFAKDLSALVSLDRSGQNFRSSRRARRNQHVHLRTPHNLIRFSGEFLARNGLPFERCNFAGRKEELGRGYSVRNLSPRAIPQIENEFVQALLVKLRELTVQLRDV